MQRKPLPKPPRDNAQIKEYTEAVERGQKDYYVSTSQDGWSVRRASASEASGRFATKTEAISYARELASSGAYVIIHGKNGMISVLQVEATRSLENASE